MVNFGVEVTQKVPLWLKLVASDEPGHGSTPRVNSAVSRLIRALSNIDNYEFPPRIVPAVEIYFEGLAESQAGTRRNQFANLAEAVREIERRGSSQTENSPPLVLKASSSGLSGTMLIDNVVGSYEEPDFSLSTLRFWLILDRAG